MSCHLLVGGIYYTVSAHFFLKFDVLEAQKIGKLKGLRESDKGQIVMATRLGQSIYKTAALVWCSWSVSMVMVMGSQDLLMHGGSEDWFVWSNPTDELIAEEVNTGSDREVSQYTVHCGLGTVPMLTSVHHRKCQQWASKLGNRAMK